MEKGCGCFCYAHFVETYREGNYRSAMLCSPFPLPMNIKYSPLFCNKRRKRRPPKSKLIDLKARLAPLFVLVLLVSIQYTQP